MTTKADRGTKRTCQNPECGSRFYDLNRDPVECPICHTVYQIEVSPLALTAAAPAAEKSTQRKAPKKPVYPVEGVKPEDVPEADADDALADIEGEDDAAVAEEDETFLEAEEEDGSDMSNIIGGPVEDDEPQ
jgi:uncharacterized protein (TIGR02300 family)